MHGTHGNNKSALFKTECTIYKTKMLVVCECVCVCVHVSVCMSVCVCVCISVCLSDDTSMHSADNNNTAEPDVTDKTVYHPG